MMARPVQFRRIEGGADRLRAESMSRFVEVPQGLVSEGRTVWIRVKAPR
jgi:hypothetical protein